MDPGARPSVGARLRRARLRRGMSGRELAAAIGVSPATLSQLENDKAQLTVARLESIATALGVSACDILAQRGADPVTGIDTGTTRSGTPTAASPTAASPTSGKSASDWRRYGPLRSDPVLAAALAEFLELGYHGTTMRRIAGRSGVSVPAIYARHDSKQAILMCILDATMTDLEWWTAAALAEGDDPVGRFRCLVENLALYHTYRRDLGFIGASEVRALEPGNQAVVSARRNRQQELVDQQVRAGVAAGLFTTGSPDDAARVVVSMCTALPTWWHPGGRLSPEEVAAEYVGYALNLVGLRTPESELADLHRHPGIGGDGER